MDVATAMTGLPIPNVPEEHLVARISLKAGDNVTTDDITPRAKSLGKSVIIGGENYGQGSSREHAAINLSRVMRGKIGLNAH